MNKTKYKKPVLAETVFELRFKPLSNWGMSSFIKFANEAAKKGFPEVVDAAQGVQLSFSPGQNQPEIKSVSRRLQTWNKEKSQLWQASSELFAANRRAPYLGWEKFRPHIYDGIDLFLKIAQPKRAESMILTYLNQIDFDEAQKLSDYLVMMPSEIMYADKIVNFGFLTEQSFKDGDTIAVSVARNPEAKKSVMLNMHIVYTKKMPPLEKKQLQSSIEIAHQRIIDAFEMSITDKQRERMEVI